MTLQEYGAEVSDSRTHLSTERSIIPVSLWHLLRGHARTSSPIGNSNRTASVDFDSRADPLAAAAKVSRTSIIITDPWEHDNPVVFVNDAFCDLTGYSRDEVLGRNLRFLRGPLTDSAAHARIRAAVLAAKPIEIEICNHRKSGEPFWNRLQITPVFGQSGILEYFFGMQIDITSEQQRLAELERYCKRMEQNAERLAERTKELVTANDKLRAEAEERALVEASLRHALTMEAVGRLAGGVAHDFNNLLMVIMGSLELVQSRIDAGRTDDLTRFTSAAIASAGRGAELTKRLLDFARRRPLVAQQVDARSLLDGMADLLRRTLGPMIAFEVIPATAIWPAWCDPGQFESAILNLAINSRDAMPDGGQLTIALSNVTLDRACSKARDGEARPGDYVAIAVNDTGIGMAPEVLARATEPFFTTKPVGQGTGLGLSTIYGFVKQFGGDLFIRSQPDQGTTVTLYLPRYRDETADDAAALASP